VNTNLPTRKSPVAFFCLVFALTIPFWLLSTIIKIEGLPDNLPVTDAGATFTPLFAASILVFHQEGWVGVKYLLQSAVDFAKIQQKIWYFPTIFTIPLLYFLAYIIMCLLKFPLPTEWYIPLKTPLLLVMYFIAAVGEEVGYMGYAIVPMLERASALKASLIMGLLHAIWHYPSMIQVGQTLPLMVWGTFFTVAMRILIVWLYNNTAKSVFVCILFHAIANTSRTIFPGSRSAFELGNGIVAYSLVMITATIVTFMWGRETLARYRYQ
jgi:uncharacterized protein